MSNFFLKPKFIYRHVKQIIKVGLSPSKKNFIIYFNDSPSEMMKYAFYLILKALFVLKIFKFLSRLFGHVKIGLIRKISLISKFMTPQSG